MCVVFIVRESIKLISVRLQETVVLMRLFFMKLQTHKKYFWNGIENEILRSEGSVQIKFVMNHCPSR
jgi:hypothetical protein